MNRAAFVFAVYFIPIGFRIPEVTGKDLGKGAGVRMLCSLRKRSML